MAAGMLLKGVQRPSWKKLRTGEGYEEVIGMESDEFNPHQKQAAKEGRGQEVGVICCPVCRRYR